MNSKMTVLAAVLVVGVLAAAGIGYAYTASYISDDSAVTPQFAVVTSLSNGEIDYNTVYDDKTNEYLSTVDAAGDKTFTVNIDASKLPAADANKKWQVNLTSYVVYFQDGSKYDGSTFTAATSDPVVKQTSTSKFGGNAVKSTGVTLTAAEIDIDTTATNAVTVTVSGDIVADEIVQNPEKVDVPYIDHVELTFTASQVAVTP